MSHNACLATSRATERTLLQSKLDTFVSQAPYNDAVHTGHNGEALSRADGELVAMYTDLDSVVSCYHPLIYIKYSTGVFTIPL